MLCLTLGCHYVNSGRSISVVKAYVTIIQQCAHVLSSYASCAFAQVEVVINSYICDIILAVWKAINCQAVEVIILLQKIEIQNTSVFAQSAVAVEYSQHLCCGVRLPQRVSWYDTKQSDGEAQVMLDHWGMRSTPSLSSLPGPLWPRVVAPDRFLSRGQIELNCVLMPNWIVWNRTVFDIETAYLCSTELFEIKLFLDRN